jgi:hypothetical protein
LPNLETIARQRLEAGEDAEGMVITQVVPPYYMTDLKTRGAVPAHAVEIYAFGAAEFREP